AFSGVIEEIPFIFIDNFTKTSFYAYFLSHFHTDHTQGMSHFLRNQLQKRNAYIYGSKITVAIITAKYEKLAERCKFLKLDNFGNRFPVYAYFLSHFHGDHIVNIDDHRLKNKLKEKNTFLYTSEITVAIISARYPHLVPYLKSLKLGRNALSIQVENREEFLEVTVLPAGHSLGSVMFLFEYKNQRILFTGDFRISKNDVSKYKHLQNNGKPIQIDALYVDTTFQDMPSFPRRSEVVSNLIPRISAWLAGNKENNVVLSVSAMFGYEGVCNQIYDEIKIKSNVIENDWQIYRQFAKQIYGVTNEETRIYLRQRQRRMDESPSQYQLDSPHTLNIEFSAFSWLSRNLEENFLTQNNLKLKVCYSTHCGRDELMHFINYLKPKKIQGFPKAFKNNNCKLEFRSFVTNKDCDSNENLEISPKKRKIVRKYDSGECQKSVVVRKKLSDVLDW
ncbi:hypothetical protein HW555_005890, partial [Spodoptera exigua]